MKMILEATEMWLDRKLLKILSAENVNKEKGFGEMDTHKTKVGGKQKVPYLTCANG